MGLFERMSEGRLALIVSLPDNTVELARAAIEGGADALKLHLNVEHRASGTQFGSFTEERDRLGAVVQAAGTAVTMGIMPGSRSLASPAELDSLESLGFRFMDCYAHDLPAHYLRYGGLKKMVALDHRFRVEDAQGLAQLGVDALEASVVEPEGYGQSLSALDLARYSLLARHFSGPVVVPTQRRVSPDDVPALARAGVSALMIGAIVTGREAASLGKATAAFRAAIRALEG